MFKKESGITLVALVITIIVLLILAGVSISLTIGENGIFRRAQDSANTYKEAETNEYKTMNEFVTEFDDEYYNLFNAVYSAD